MYKSIVKILFVFSTVTIFLAFLLLTGCAKKKTIYVSPTGELGKDKTITEALKNASVGDTIYVESGIYRETVNIDKSGITIFAPNKNTVITGTDVLKNFIQDTKGIYKAYAPHKVTQLFVNGIPQALAKYPNQNVSSDLFKFTTIKVKVSGDTLRSDEINLPDGYFNGASVWMILDKRWVGGTAKVKQHIGNTLKLSNISLSYKGEGIAFLSDVKNCLDNDGEWFWEKDTLYYFNQNIDMKNSLIEAKTRETLINFKSVKNVTVSGISGFAGNVKFNQTDSCKLSNGSFKYVNDYNFINAKSVYSRGKNASLAMYGLGIALFGKNDRLENCEVMWAAGDCVSLYGKNNVIIDCKIHDGNYRGTDAAPLSIGGNGNKILYSDIYNGGRDVISAPSAEVFKIMYNTIHQSGLIAWDVGLIYTYDTDGKNAEIAYNVVHDAHSDNPETWWGASGIYLDNNSRNFLVHHNVSYNAKGLGIQVNDPGRNIRVYNNTVFNTTYDMTPYNNGQFPGVKGADCKFYNNYFDRPVKPTEWIEEKNNIYSKEDFLQNRKAGNYIPQENSPLIDQGIIIDELKDIPFKGKAPDIGAFEKGMQPWKAGLRYKFK